MASGLDAMPTPYQGNAMDEVRRAAEAANRVDVLHVPGGQVAGMLSEERNNVPAKEIVERMVERSVADFERPAGDSLSEHKQARRCIRKFSLGVSLSKGNSLCKAY